MKRKATDAQRFTVNEKKARARAIDTPLGSTIDPKVKPPSTSWWACPPDQFKANYESEVARIRRNAARLPSREGAPVMP